MRLPKLARTLVRSRAWSLVLPIALWSCASAPAPRQAPVATPPAWGAMGVDHSEPAQQWWLAFDDSLAASLVQEALRNNPSVQIAAATVDAARAQARIAGAGTLPAMQAGAAGSKAKRSNIGFPTPAGAGSAAASSTTSTAWSGDLTVNWEVDVWGRLRASHSAALADVQVAEADWRGAQLSLAAQTLRTYFACVEARRQVDLAQSTRGSYAISNQQVQLRYERGLRPTLDVLLSQASLSAAEANLQQRLLQLDSATRQLEILVGRYPAGALEPSTDLPAMQPVVPAGLPARLIARRPDLVAAERQLAASDARVQAARRALYPRISLTASGGRSSSELSDLVDGDFSVWNLIGNVTQPIFQGGRLRAGVDLAETGSERALLAYVQTALRAFGEVESGLAAEDLLRAQEGALTAASSESADARKLAEQRYLGGLTDLLTLFTSQRNAFEAESRLITVQRQRLDARVNLHLALGGTITGDTQ